MEGRITIRNLALAGLVIIALVVFGLLLSKSPEAQTPSPSEVDCPAASQIEEFTQTGDFTTDYLDVPTGQLYVTYDFPNAASGIIYRLEVNFEKEPPPAEPGGVDPVAQIGAVGLRLYPKTARLSKTWAQAN